MHDDRVLGQHMHLHDANDGCSSKIYAMPLWGSNVLQCISTYIYIYVAMYCSVFLSHADVISWFFSFHIFSGFVLMLWSVGWYPMILHIFLYSIVFCCWAGSSGITITYCYNMLPWTTVASHMSSWYGFMFQLVLGWSSWLAANSWCCTMLSHGLGRD